MKTKNSGFGERRIHSVSQRSEPSHAGHQTIANVLWCRTKPRHEHNAVVVALPGAIGDVLALASLSTSLGATGRRGSGAHNLYAGHGSCARLLAAGGPKLGQGRRPNFGIGA